MDKVLESALNIELSSKVLDHLEFTYEDYMQYLGILSLLDEKTQKYYLLTLKDREIVNNQEAEYEDNFMMEFYRIYQKKDSILVAMESFKDGEITKNELKKLHRFVIKGSSDDIPSNYDFRKDNDKWVGSFTSMGEKNIDYIPPRFEDIDSLIEQTLLILNKSTGNDILDNPLIKSFVVHALIAYIQPFGNGNTRLARVLQHGKIWHMSNEVTGLNMPMPTLYLSKNYLLTRGQYRGLISEFVSSLDFNRWINYNLNMVDEQLNFCSNNIQRIRK